jgi:hypothetical protein
VVHIAVAVSAQTKDPAVREELSLSRKTPHHELRKPVQRFDRDFAVDERMKLPDHLAGLDMHCAKDAETVDGARCNIMIYEEHENPPLQ